MQIQKMLLILSKMRRSVVNGVPHDLSSKPTAGLTDVQIKALQESLNRAFTGYIETWLLPPIKELEQHLKPKKTAGQSVKGR